MAGRDINRVVVAGRLTAEPELRKLESGTSVCRPRLAVNGRKKTATGEWADDPNFFDVAVWGGQGETCARYLGKGRRVAVDGRLSWREWVHDDTKRQAVEIVAEIVQFLDQAES